MSRNLEVEREKIRDDGEFTLRYDSMDRLVTVEGIPSGEFEPTELRFPIRVVTEITSLCNMRCRYCSQYNNESGPKLKLEDVHDIIEQVNTGKAFELALRGAEATLHPDFNEIWDHAAAQDFTSATLITNGLKLDEQKALNLLQNIRSKLIVSLDGPDEVNSHFRDPRQYKKVMKWLIPVLHARGDQIVILSTVYKDNLPYLPEFCDYLSQLGLRHHHFSLLKRIGNIPFIEQEFATAEQIKHFVQTLNGISERNPNYLPIINSPVEREQNSSQGILTQVPIPKFTEYYCGAGIKIMADGKIGISQIIYFDEAFRLGKVGESLQNLWDRSHEIRRQHSQLARERYQYLLGFESH
ncbi:MAG: hypothetical protein US60_C0005G0003 [Microgenomates group bacterium GW2011_GWC1_37_8]|uniref:Radical SAM domain protein n=1 Tax=Candidatus Woesebacteria bacterium GW2011_GWB1_38_8 TaxID=1618570 RepID=A0A0G0L2V2_9BACT|nr:MAG: hypothetical protein US60_C0005G0003 [Microgenomates group bacterium GW2011_GWC1_37_8]KKQ86298.1 MAG: Radical SAM domain protein [Candidatus Woesebacteria bacterium GW2011_GWB1_38_8]